jgi:hypothetical protein
VQGENRPGAVAALASHLAEVGINIRTMQTACAGEDRYNVLFWVKPRGRAEKG